MPGESIEVQDPVKGDTEFEKAFEDVCDRDAKRGARWRAQREEGILELFKVISGSNFTVDAYDWSDRGVKSGMRGNPWYPLK